MQLVGNYLEKLKINKMIIKIKNIIKNITFFLIMLIIILYYNNHHKESYIKINSFNYFKIKNAIENNDKKTISYLTKKIIKNSNKNIYFDIACLTLYKSNKNRLDKIDSKKYLNKIMKNRKSILYENAQKKFKKISNNINNKKIIRT